MSNINNTNKIAYYFMFKYDSIIKLLPYKKVIIINNNISSNITLKMNIIYLLTNFFNVTFPDKNRVIVSFSGNRNFNTILLINSYLEINDIINNIALDINTYSRKKFDNINNFIDKIYIITNNNEEIDITNIFDLFIEYKEKLLLSDIALFYDKIDIKNIKITYYNNMEYQEILIDYELYKNNTFESMVNINK